jgi:hypothetical protein
VGRRITLAVLALGLLAACGDDAEVTDEESDNNGYQEDHMPAGWIDIPVDASRFGVQAGPVTINGVPCNLFIEEDGGDANVTMAASCDWGSQ